MQLNMRKTADAAASLKSAVIRIGMLILKGENYVVLNPERAGEFIWRMWVRSTLMEAEATLGPQLQGDLFDGDGVFDMIDRKLVQAPPEE